MPDVVAGVLLAAGASRRFGRPKQIEPWMGETLVAHAARSFLGGGLTPVVVVVPPGSAIQNALTALDVTLVENAQGELGIGHSIALGIGALPGTVRAALIGVADQPLVDENVIRRLVEAFVPGAIVEPRYGDHPGNPRIFDRRFFSELASLRADVGGQLVARAHPEAIVERTFPERVGMDIDRPEDWRRLLSALPAEDGGDRL
jgi:molybdenum cofactor cytidylyltransferase